MKEIIKKKNAKPIKYILNLHTKIVTEGKSQSIQFFSQLEKQVEYF